MAAPLPPIQRMPDDILRQIFRLTLPPDGSSVTPDPTETPVLLTHVSRHWRSVSTDYGALWSSLKFRHTTRMVAWSTEKVRVFAECIERSKQAPLHLLIAVPLRNKFVVEAPNLLQTLVVPYVNRLASLAMKCAPIEHLHALPSGSFPHLESMALSFNPSQLSNFDWEANGPVRAFANAPSLRRVALKQRSAIFGRPKNLDWSTHFIIPWDQLTHVMEDMNGGAPNIPVLQRYIECCPNLENIFIPLSHVDAVLETGRRVHAGKLRGLSFQSLIGEEWPVLLRHVDAPRLEWLCVTSNALTDMEGWAEVQREGQAAVDGFLQRLGSFRSLKYMSINSSGGRFSYATLRAILKATPTVETLDLAVGGSIEPLLEVIHLQNLDPANGILPNLHTLIIEDLDGLDPVAFFTFLSTRRQCPIENQLRKIVLYFREQCYLHEAQPTLQTIYGFPGLEVETHVVPMRGQWRYLWMDRDPELQNWKEGVEIMAGVPRPEATSDGRIIVGEEELDSE